MSPSTTTNTPRSAEEHPCGRRRFNAAHELFHLIAHRRVPGSVASSPAIHKVMEKQAHRFAGAFLFPADSFADEVYSLQLDSLVRVKARWRVSIQMIVRRARSLGVISQDVYERTFRDLSRRGFKTNEPLDDTQKPEQPSMLAGAIKLMLDERATTREDLMHRLPFKAHDVEVLAGLTPGFLSSSSWGSVAELKLRQRHADPQKLPTPMGRVLPFKPKA